MTNMHTCKAEQIHKMTTIFTQTGGPRLSFWVKIVVMFRICSASEAVLSFSAWKKSCDSRAPWICQVIVGHFLLFLKQMPYLELQVYLFSETYFIK